MYFSYTCSLLSLNLLKFVLLFEGNIALESSSPLMVLILLADLPVSAVDKGIFEMRAIVAIAYKLYYVVGKGPFKCKPVRRTPKAQLVATPATKPTRHRRVALLSSNRTRTIMPNK